MKTTVSVNYSLDFVGKKYQLLIENKFQRDFFVTVSLSKLSYFYCFYDVMTESFYIDPFVAYTEGHVKVHVGELNWMVSELANVYGLVYCCALETELWLYNSPENSSVFCLCLFVCWI